MGLISKVFKTYKPLFWSNLPYNINWLIKDFKPIKEFLDKNNIVIYDIGSRGGKFEEVENLKKFIEYIGFDADKNECDNLNLKLNKFYAKSKFLPYFIGENNVEVDFHIYKYLGHSSTLLPNERFEILFDQGGFEILEKFKMLSKSIDFVQNSEDLSFPDILKLDTQGSEFEILKNADNILENTLMISTEVEFIEMYKNQKLFFKISELLYDKGFELIYLNRVFHNRNNFNGESRGQLIWGDALFARREDKLEKLSNDKIIKYVILLINFGHLDIAKNIIDNNKELFINFENIETYFKYYNKSIFNKIKRVLFFQIQKILFIILHFLKSNKSIYDDDRSWPIR